MPIAWSGMENDEFTDVESQLGPEQPADPGAGVPWGGVTTVVGIALIVLFAVQNTESATIEFLWLSGDFPLSLVILVTALASALFATTAGAFYRRRRRRRRAEKMELKELRSQEQEPRGED